MTTKATFSGTYTAIVTPFLGGHLDLASFERLFATQQKLDGIVIGGTTGESPTLNQNEFETLLREALRQRKNSSLKIIAGTGSNVTEHAIAKTCLADRLGADAMLVVAPYYNKPSPEGLFRHFSAIAQHTSKPIILYSVPSRCGIEIPVEIITRLREQHPHIIGLKEASEQCSRIDALKIALGDDFHILSGNDNMTLAFMALAACGVISVASNLCPDAVQNIVRAMLQNHTTEARTWHQDMLPLFRDLFIESNPVPIKHLLAQQKLITSPEVRLPLVTLTAEHARRLESTWQQVSQKLSTFAAKTS
ncbi:MAG: 4-hydroxy-tetrahydrodipicolinate synthase [Puniceicoccales bacterium]|jgi:4-hydroxy-tetrahydrodipicolinate synthase|nr:4-hydroxy-tetrahydrodipicolinate synthase [Puniceicoccales bacterium]